MILFNSAQFKPKSTNRAFTLIELLVVVAIIGVLSSVVIATLSIARTKAIYAANKQLDAITDHAIGDSKVFEMIFEEDGATNGGIASGTRVIKDSSGYNNNGTPSGNPTYSSDTPFGTGYSLSFNGTGDVSTSNSSSISITKAITLSVWVKSTASVPQILIGRFGCGDYSNSYYLWKNFSNGGTPNEVSFYLFGASMSNGRLDAYAQIDDGRWHYIVGTYDGSYNRVFIDGALVAQAANSGDIYDDGCGLHMGDNSLSGSIDNVRIYSRALDTSEIQKLYAMDAAKHGVAFVGEYGALPELHTRGGWPLR